MLTCTAFFRRFALTTFASVGLLALLQGCQSPAGLPPSTNLKPSLAAPECPKIGGIYELNGEALPGMVDFYRNRNSKLTLNAMLGVAAPADILQDAVRVELLHDDTLELVNRHDGAITAHQLDLQPEDRVTCNPNHITIYRTRFEGGNDPEPLRNISNIAQDLTVEGDGTLLVRTRIMNRSKSAFFSTPMPEEEYGARFRRLD
jgi:hypothetical protein